MAIMSHSSFDRELKRKKQSIKKTVFKEVKDNISDDIPNSLKELMNDAFEKQYPMTQSDFIELQKKVKRQLKELKENSAFESKDLEDPCKYCIQKMVNELYDLRPGIGIGNQLGQYIARIWQFNEVVFSIISSEENTFKKSAKIYHLREFYKTAYEFTIKFFTEFAHEIALEKQKTNDVSSKTFLKKYRNAVKRKGGKPLKGDLIVYLREQKYLAKGTCLFLQNSLIRDSICHENFYFDEKTNLLTFGNKTISYDEFSKYFEEIYKVNQYLISQNLERAEKENLPPK